MIDVDKIPEVLRSRQQWVLWRTRTRDGKPTKIPYQINGKPAKTDDASTWTAFHGAAAVSPKYDGIGYVFAADDEYVGIDLDGCRNPDTGELAGWAREWVTRFDTYTEVSPSGTGVKLWAIGKSPLPKGKKKSLTTTSPPISGKSPGVEIYDHKRYFAMTGWHVEGMPTNPQARQQVVDAFVKTFFPKKSKVSHNHNGHAHRGNVLDRAAKYLDKIPGAISGQGGHNHTFKTACALVLGFDLSPKEAFPLLDEWNQKCDPQWDEHELRHKLDDADNESGERGYLRDKPLKHHVHDDDDRGDDGDIVSGKPCWLTDTGNARRLVRLHGADLRYCHPWKKWLIWDGKRWKIDNTAEVMRRAKDIPQKIMLEAADKLADDKDEAKKFAAWAFKCESAERLRAMVGLADSEPGIPILPEELDRDPWLLCVENGTVDLRSGELRQHAKSDLITKLAPIEYPTEAGEDCPLWQETIRSIFAGDDDLIGYVQRHLGYCLTGNVQEQMLPIWHGMGANGKSTVLNAMIDIIGEYAKRAPSELLMEKKGDQHPTMLADLAGRRLVVCAETGDGRRLAEGLVKELTGGDVISARRMKEDYWQFWPTHKLILATNHKPIVRGNDHGIWRRVSLVPFVQRYWDADKGESGPPALQADKQLPERLRSEYPSILRWLVAGCLQWQRDGLAMPDKVRAATGEYRSQQDVLGQFLSDCCIIQSGFTASLRLVSWTPGSLAASYSSRPLRKCSAIR